MLYGLSAVGLYQLLGAAGVPTFYDKLLQVPVLNLSVRLLDRAARSRWLEALDPARLGRSLAPRQRYVAYLAVWVVVFALMSAARGWETATRGSGCRSGSGPARRDGRARARISRICSRSTAMRDPDGRATRAAIVHRERTPSGRATLPADLAHMTGMFERGCRLGFVPACRNALRAANGNLALERAAPTLADYPIVLRGSKGPITDRTPSALRARACEQGWPDTCGRQS